MVLGPRSRRAARNQPGWPPGPKLNVLLVSIDTCRADRLSCYGYKRPTTPNIDAVARDGALFKMALTPVPITTPAHSSMFTGTYPPTHGVHLNSLRPPGRIPTSPWRTILRRGRLSDGRFRRRVPLGCPLRAEPGLRDLRRPLREKRNRSCFSRRAGEEVSRPALAWLDEHAQKPFFLFLHYYDAHQPYAPHPPYTSAYTDDPYAGEIAYVDNCIGRVLDRLRELGVYDNTLVIITGGPRRRAGRTWRDHALLLHLSRHAARAAGDPRARVLSAQGHRRSTET